MQNIEFIRALPYFFQHKYVVSEWVANLRIEAQAALAACDEFR